jgi:hypothetical protein
MRGVRGSTLTNRLVFFSRKPVRLIWRIRGSTVCGDCRCDSVTRQLTGIGSVAVSQIVIHIPTDRRSVAYDLFFGSGASKFRLRADTKYNALPELCGAISHQEFYSGLYQLSKGSRPFPFYAYPPSHQLAKALNCI